MPDNGWQVGIDIGGTFTDLVALHAVDRRAALDQGADPAQRSRRQHQGGACRRRPRRRSTSTTSCTARRWSPTPSSRIASSRWRWSRRAGFEDVLDIGRAGRQHLYRLDLPPRRAAQVPPERRIGLAERVDHTGAVVRAPDAAAIAEAVQQATASGVESVAVSLLHAYANPGARARARRGAEGGAALRLAVARGQSRDARVRAHRHDRAQRLGHADRRALSRPPAARGPGRAPACHAFGRRHGLARGRRAAAACRWRCPARPPAFPPPQHVAATLGLDKVLSFDMGGTTTDVCLVVNGAAEISTDSKLAGRPVRQPMVAVESIGAGGGSLVTLGTGGLSIGPESAGAEPGPAAYGRGGTRPTVTDANAVLGYLDTTRRLGGAISLDVAAAEAALAPLAKRLGVSVVELALGVQRVANATMVRALARVTVERGVDGRQCTLLAFGGAGPMHAAQPGARVRHRRDRRAALLLGLLGAGLHRGRHELHPAAGGAHAEHALGRRPLRRPA